MYPDSLHLSHCCWKVKLLQPLWRQDNFSKMKNAYTLQTFTEFYSTLILHIYKMIHFHDTDFCNC